jgi:hypothetical protein
MDCTIAMKRILPLFLLAALPLYSVTAKAEGPSDVNYVDGTQVFIKNPKWHQKEGGSWLFTCRLEASAERLVKPVAHLHIFNKKSSDEGEEITWEKKAIVRRNKFDRSYGSRKANFVRVFVDDLPKELDALTVEFVNEAPGKD